MHTEQSIRRELKKLHHDCYHNTYVDLSYTTMRRWFDRKTLQLHPDVQKRWEERKGRQWGSGTPYILGTVPEVEAYIIKALQHMRTASQCINSRVISALIKAVLLEKAPDMLNQFAVSRRWCRYWVRRKLDWSYKKGSTSGQKLPRDWEDQVRRMIQRSAIAVKSHNVRHPSLVINWDQSSVNIMSPSPYTYERKKSKQVPILGLMTKDV